MSKSRSYAESIEGLRLPLLCAPMFLVSGASLAVAACNAGIIGSVPSGGSRSHEEFANVLGEIDSGIAPVEGSPRPLFAVNLSLNARRRLGDARFLHDLEACRRHRVPLIITTSGSPADIVPEVHGWGGLVLHDATTVRHAEKAAEAGVDGLVLVGAGGGGHSGLLNPFTFVPQVRRFFDGLIVLGGTLGTGAAMVAARHLGADLCSMGTRFIATHESLASDDYKSMLVSQRAEDLVFTPAYTKGIPANFMRESIRRNGLDPGETEPHGPHSGGDHEPKAWRDIWSAGQGIGLIDDIPRVAHLVDRLEAEFRAAKAGPRTAVLRRMMGKPVPHGPVAAHSGLIQTSLGVAE